MTIYNRHDGSIIRRIAASGTTDGGQTVDAMAFLPDGQTLAIGLSNGDFQLYNIQTSQSRNLLKGSPNNYKQGVAFSPEGKTFARSEGGSIHFYDTETAKLKSVINGGGDAIAFSADGKRVASIGYDEKLNIYNAQTCAVLRSLPAKVYLGSALVALSPDGSKVSDGYHLWDVATGKVERTLDGQRSEGLAFSPDGALLCAGSQYSAELWRIQ